MSMKNEIAKVFHLFDVDNDGKIPISDIGVPVRALCSVITQHDLQTMLNKCCPGSARLVDLSTFASMVTPLLGKNCSKQVEEAFDTIDKEGTGFIGVMELRHLLTSSGDRLTTEEFNTFLEELDVDSGGRVARHGFLELLSRH